ncbi:StmR [Salmonella enterica subsp. enterica]|uniref:StmR n=1 Tax=Salmonella enterica I TaxID=59201 RepID=A0A447TVJ9_SALET|nr:StmR [Salmonella enterica subsp. enterica]
MNGSSSGYCLKSQWLLCWQKRILLRRVKQIALSILKDEFFLLFPREIGLSLYDAVIKACGKAGFEPKIGQLVPQNFVSH